MKSKASFREKLRTKYSYVDKSFILFILTLFQAFSFIPVAFREKEEILPISLLVAGYIVFEWFYVLFMSIVMKKVNFELELIAFFLSGIGVCLIGSKHGFSDMAKQLICVIAGVIAYDILLWFLKDVRRAMAVRNYIGIIALILFAGCFVYIRFIAKTYINGAYNWIYIGGISFQPSEFVKIAFIFVGGATLDRILKTTNIILYIVYAVSCIGILFLMKDFGTALIYFFTFIVIAYMRSGDVRSILYILAGALLGAVMILIFLPHVLTRFETYRHVWEDVNGRGYQQTRVLIYAVSGGLRGLGIGNGQLRDVYASTSDLVFGMICEELGILIAFAIVISFAFIAVYAIRCSRSAPSTFYSISACAAAAMLLFQTCLNIFGITDILPLTGVTLPFISKGGSSVIACWALFAFIKAADIRAYPKLYKT